MLRLAAALAVALTLAGCAGDDATEAGPETATAAEHEARVTIRTDDGPVSIDAEVADTSEERRVGLMHRRSLPRRAGMVFLFERPVDGGFWMKNTLIPLSIAFFDAEGRIVRILDMEPCPSDPCPVYDPGVRYTGALEVNQGAFDEWGVAEGDELVVDREAQ